MPFEINLPSRLDVCTLRCAGMETDAYQDRSMDVIIRDAPVPFEVKLPYFLSDPPGSVSVTMLENGKAVRLRIAAPSAAIERRIRKYMERYSVENDGQAVAEREHQSLWKQINAILRHERMSYEKLSRGEALLNRGAIEALMRLAKEVERSQVADIADLFANGHVVRQDQEFAVRWLIKLFAQNPDPFERDQLSLRIEENAVPQVAEELIRLIENRKLGESRSVLLVALAKTKHPRAADVIASVLHEDGMAWAGLQALARLKAKMHVEKIRRCLKDPDSDVRREAKKALKKLGFPVETPPSPLHLVKGRAKIPKGLEEWSQNLDMGEVEPVLKKLASLVKTGFGKAEIAEVLGVAEEMAVEQTCALRFLITAARSRGELWVVIFMDDIDSPDLAIHAAPALIRKFEPLVPLK